MEDLSVDARLILNVYYINMDGGFDLIHVAQDRNFRNLYKPGYLFTTAAYNYNTFCWVEHLWVSESY
jgi:hypothetical protein